MFAMTETAPRDCINSLGIPVDNLSLEQAIDEIVRMAKLRDGKARLVSTLNVDFLVNSLGCAFSRPRHPELLNVLRGSDLVTADGFPIVWLSRIMGKPLQARVTGADMVPALAERAVPEGLSIFLLGGGEGSAEAAAKKLQETCPGLKIAGTAAPMVHTAGAGLVDYAADDEKVRAHINASGADVLLVGLGNPKQELWFNRNRSSLQVPVSIGVGGSFEFVNGSVRRAPGWVQRLNMEWLFRITQDPARLWRRYAVGLSKLAVLTAPIVYYRLKERVLAGATLENAAPVFRWRSVWSSRDQALSILSLPPRLSPAYMRALAEELCTGGDGIAMRLLDFSGVKHIDAAGHQEFFRIAALLRQPASRLSLLGLSPAVKRHLAASRVVDILEEARVDSTLGALSSAGNSVLEQDIGCQSYVMDRTTLVFLSGRVSADGLSQLGLTECLLHSTRDRTCILDLRNVNLIESAAIGKLHGVIDQIHSAGAGSVLISGAVPHIRQMFRMSGLADNVVLVDDETLLASITSEGLTDAG